uniref:Uncharacterized protein n=1 Tax=Lepeophtheirus salmonis TaxID=72036 RepID=A0A0K2TMV9_LEPSM
MSKFMTLVAFNLGTIVAHVPKFMTIIAFHVFN